MEIRYEMVHRLYRYGHFDSNWHSVGAVMKYRCLDCDVSFDNPGVTYSNLDRFCTTPIACCGKCGSDDYEEVEPLLDIALERMNSFFLDKV